MPPATALYCSRWLAAVLCALIFPGCVCPVYFGWCKVTSDVATRTGHDLGPVGSNADISVDGLVDWNDGLAEEEAMAVGLWNHPAYRELLADLSIARADVIQAAQLSNPQINTMFPLGPKQWELALMLPVDVLWLRPIRVAAAQIESERVAERLVQDGLDIVREVRLAYINWLLAIERAELANEGATLRNDFARIAEARLTAGAVSELEVSAVRLDAAAGEGEALRAARDVELAGEQLRYALGIQLAPIALLPPPMGSGSRSIGRNEEASIRIGSRRVVSEGRRSYSPAEAAPVDLDVDALVAEAVAGRPDLRAAQLAVAAAEERVELANYDYWNVAAILPDLNSRGSKGFEAGPGLQFTFPLFHQNQGAIARAEAEAARLRSQYARLRDTAALEVRRACAQMQQAEQERQWWREQIVPQAESAVVSARRALQEDGVSLVLVLETTRQLLSSQARALEAEAQVWRSIAELERSVGRRLADMPEVPLRPGSREGTMEFLTPPMPGDLAESFQ